MKRTLQYSLAAFSVLLFTNSCIVLEKDLIAVQDELKVVRNDFQKSREDLAAETAKVVALQQQLSDCQNSKAELQNSLNSSISSAGQSNQQIQRLLDQVNELTQSNRKILQAKSQADSLKLVVADNITNSLTKEEIREIEIKTQKTDITLSFADNILYNIGTNEISDRGAEALKHVAAIINNYPTYDIIVEGNTTSQPVEDTTVVRHNWDLSAIRAASVVKYLQDKCNIDPQRMSASGRAEFNPVESNESLFGQRKNLRTVIIIRPKTDPVLELIK